MPCSSIIHNLVESQPFSSTQRRAAHLGTHDSGCASIEQIAAPLLERLRN